MPPDRSTSPTRGVVVLESEQWQALQAAHQQRVDALVAGRRARAGRGVHHPVEDFLFSYYSHRPARLRRWHPGVGTALALDADSEQVPAVRGHVVVEVPGHDHSRHALTLDVDAFVARRGEALRHIAGLLAETARRPAFLGCFGMHEWAMVYRLSPDDVRHAAWPLRLSAAATDEVVQTHRIRCSHFDAYRFFTPDALPHNELQPTRATTTQLEQPGCLHVGMDLYKWAYKLAPATPSSLVLACFELARDIRELDMRASPYDLTALGYLPIAVETAAGKVEYAQAQRQFAERAEPLRANLIEVCERLLT